jgi:anti-anti-sigma regulatory factor
VLFKHEIQLTRRFTSDPLPPAEVMQRLNERLLDDLQVPGAFVTAACGLLDLRTGELSIASAGHTTVCLARADDQLEVITPTGPALGLFQDAQYEAHDYTLAQGDRLLMYTDGLADVGGDAPPGAAQLLAAIVEQGDVEDRLQQAFLSVAQGLEREDRDDMTVLMLEAKTGQSRFTQLDEIESMQRLSNSDKPGALARARVADALFLVISGRATWVLGETLLSQAEQAVAARQTLIIDLGQCEYLDSTLLGTLHQIVSLARDANTQVELQHVGESIVEAFEELSLGAVIACIQHTARPLPDRVEALNVTDVDESKQQQRLLRAHEVLMELSESNHETFAPVVDALREELL